LILICNIKYFGKIGGKFGPITKRLKKNLIFSEMEIISIAIGSALAFSNVIGILLNDLV